METLRIKDFSEITKAKVHAAGDILFVAYPLEPGTYIIHRNESSDITLIVSNPVEFCMYADIDEVEGFRVISAALNTQSPNMEFYNYGTQDRIINIPSYHVLTAITRLD